MIERVAHAVVPTVHGDFTAYAYRSQPDGEEHLAYVMAGQMSLEMISTEGSGLLVYLRGHEGRGIGLSTRLWRRRIDPR